MVVKHKAPLRIIAVYLALNILFEAVAPNMAFALTAGPNSPEFSSFEPVATTDMVNVFSGDFTYNLPVIQVPGGPDGGDYALSLAYHSGTGVEEEASWVGHGWTLSPGAINRNLRGFPDEYNAAKVTYYNKVRPNWTASVTGDLGLEAFSLDVSLGLAHTIRYNNYRGFSKTTGFNVGIKGMANIGLSSTAGTTTVSASINPAKILREGIKAYKKAKEKSPNEKKDKKSRREERIATRKSGYQSKGSAQQKVMGRAGNEIGLMGGNYGLFTYSDAVKPTDNTPYLGGSFALSASLQGCPFPAPVGVEGGINGNFNIQINDAKRMNKAYGYMHSPAVSLMNKDVITDYYVEKNAPYSKRNYFIGVPFNNADNFMLSGEGLSGGFRMYKPEAGHFYPNFSTSNMYMAQIGVEFMAGTDIGPGFDFGLGAQSLKIEDWPEGPLQGTTKNFQFSSNTPVIRFNNDLGGSVEYSSSPAADAATISSANSLSVPGVKKFKADVGGTLNTLTNNVNVNKGTGVNGSSYTAYHTLEDLINNTSTSYRFNRNSNITQVDAHKSTAVAGEYEKTIAEYSVFNPTGTQYVYGLPVLTRNELSIQVGVDKNSAITHNHLVAQNVNEHLPDNLLANNQVIVGERSDVPYASTYLLTQVFTPDYVDLLDDGPTNDDFGGWTRFEYRQKYGAAVGGTWYNWRTPYAGLLYQKNQISNTRDDMGMLNKGEKEVYYTKAIETKTHVAFFITNKTSASDFSSYYPSGSSLPGILAGSGTRLDGWSADPHASDNIADNGTQELEYLQRIVLFSKGRMDKPIKTVNFKYNYSLVRNLPNNQYGEWPGNVTTANYNQSGKLTLEKVWFEYEGITQAKTAPYVFTYAYPKYSAAITSLYPGIAAWANRFEGDGVQNPNYTAYALDMWGNHQYNGEARKQKMQPWVYQGYIDPSAAYDPAAWQLKQIRLPSGGEIHVQYEEKDYSSVQDRTPMAMVSLLSNSIDGKPGDNEYFLNLEDLGLTAAAYSGNTVALQAAIKKQYDLIKAEFEGRDDKKIYFKYLYGLTEGFTPDLDNCKAEYITGYAKVSSVHTDLNNYSYISIKLGTTGKEDSPIHSALDYVRTQKGGRLSNNECITIFDPLEDQLLATINNLDGIFDPTVNSTKTELKKFAKDILKTKLVPGIYTEPTTIGQIGSINTELSYLRVPMSKSKRGGGIRVKRLLMYDSGLETGDENIYGSEYHYKKEDGESSGAATNEPSAGREENALVTFLPKRKQTFLNKIVAGEDKKDAEGPIGESTLPAPSVGYARVVVSNIHSGKTGTGYSVHEFYTCRDYPFDKFYQGTGNGVEMTKLEDSQERDYMIVPAGLFNFKKNRTWVTQGFRFIINSMHGQMKSLSTYGGEYGGSNNYLSSSKVYRYFEPGEELDMLTYTYNAATGTGTYSIVPGIPGKEEDLTMEMRTVSDKMLDLNLEVDVSIGIIIPVPPIYITAFPSLDYQDSQINTHATTKVIRYPAIVKSIEVFQDGAKTKIENLAFDKNTGDPIVTRTTDGFNGLTLGVAVNPHDGSYYNLSLPASWYYPQLGQKMMNPANTNQLKASAGSITTYGAGANPLSSGWFALPVGVVGAEVQTYADNWYSGTDANISSVMTEYNLAGSSKLAELNTKLRPRTNYIYKKEIVEADNAAGNGRIYSGGLYTGFAMFPQGNFTDPNIAPAAEWLPLNTVIAYDPNGNPVAERNLLGIYSAARYGYKGTLPVLVAKNAEYANVQFHNFEDQGDYTLTVNSSHAHSGKSSWQYSSGVQVFKNLLFNNQLQAKGASVKLWLKSTNPHAAGNLHVLINGIASYCRKISQNGEWSLYEARIEGSGWGTMVPSSTQRFDVTLAYSLTSGEQVYIDDIRFQPLDAQMMTYVYDVASKRLLAQFDDQHFGLYYQYNEEGKLVRKMKETEKGMMTIQETQSNTPAITR